MQALRILRPPGLALLCAGWAGAALGACPGETQMEMNDCAAAAYGQADAALNAVWPQTRAMMDQIGAGADLLDAQRKWIAFRDAACQAESAPFEGGSIQPLVWFSCLARLTLRRTEDLQALVTN
jgi:uncharacterized protein YecT (DUF1311 family)